MSASCLWTQDRLQRQFTSQFKQSATLRKFSMSISTTMFWNFMFIMAATVSSCDRISVGPKMTPRLDTVIRLNWFCVDTLQTEDTAMKCCKFTELCSVLQRQTLEALQFHCGVPKPGRRFHRCQMLLCPLVFKSCSAINSSQNHIRDKVFYE